MWILARVVLVFLILAFYVAMGTCLLLIMRFEASWDRGDPAEFPEPCRGITSDPGALAGFVALGIVILLILRA
jgi:hypothetical protein